MMEIWPFLKIAEFGLRRASRVFRLIGKNEERQIVRGVCFTPVQRDYALIPQTSGVVFDLGNDCRRKRERSVSYGSASCSSRETKTACTPFRRAVTAMPIFRPRIRHGGCLAKGK